MLTGKRKGSTETTLLLDTQNQRVVCIDCRPAVGSAQGPERTGEETGGTPWTFKALPDLEVREVEE